MLYKNLILIGTVLAFLGSVMTSTSPDNFSAPLLVFVFGLLYILIAALITLAFQVLAKLKIIRFGFAKIVKIAVTCSIVPIFLLLLHSIGQLTARDVLLALAFFVLLYFYYGRMTKNARA